MASPENVAYIERIANVLHGKAYFSEAGRDVLQFLHKTPAVIDNGRPVSFGGKWNSYYKQYHNPKSGVGNREIDKIFRDWLRHQPIKEQIGPFLQMLHDSAVKVNRESARKAARRDIPVSLSDSHEYASLPDIVKSVLRHGYSGRGLYQLS